VKDADTASMIRVDQAGEYGAARIYAGQLAVLGNRHPASRPIRHMAVQEQRHLERFNAMVAERGVRPTLLQPFWHVAGFALGAAPGFTVGAVAALASNLFFGQGPWTPWQMVAWGLCGVLGAGLAAATGGKPLRRIPLGLWCAAAALGFGAIMDLSTWTTFGRHTLSEYLIVSGTALPFNITHAVGSFAFAVAFGPALLGALGRFRMRFEVEWGELRPTQESMRLPIG